jgi:hypothetical protein
MAVKDSEKYVKNMLELINEAKFLLKSDQRLEK